MKIVEIDEYNAVDLEYGHIYAYSNTEKLEKLNVTLTKIKD